MWVSEEERVYHECQERAWGKFKHRRRKKSRSQKKAERWLAKRQVKQERQVAENRCRAYLKVFWEKFNAALADEERLELLKQAANPPWPRVSARLRVSLRAKYKRNWWKLLNFEILECGCCQSEKPAEKHHIVPLAFGGTNEDLNLLKIGLNCHDAIHPWMKA